ncbi:hypothetical protein Sd1012_3442 [Shigella dysenteriae 1012]|nr:hypothetical protein Sd1012_3442 [Shigella dysenteriae 1012]
MTDNTFAIATAFPFRNNFSHSIRIEATLDPCNIIYRIRMN